jgi:CheY-like chemotaxis protein
VLQGLWSGLPAQFGAIVSAGAELGAIELGNEWTPRAGMYFAELERTEPTAGKLIMAFDLSLAIACAGQLLLVPDEKVREKIEAGELEQQDRDGMGECVSTFAAAIGAAARTVVGTDEHWVLGKAVLDIAELDVPDALTVASGELKIGDLAKGRFEVIAALSLWGAAPDKRRADVDAEASSSGGGVELTAEELAAIRAATQSSMPGKTLVVVPSLSQREEWVAVLEQSGIDFAFVGDPFEILQLCRTAVIEAVVIDADACPSGGLTVLAAIRGRTPDLIPRVVVASRPTRTHLVSCLAAGATAYATKPIALETLREHLGNI